MGLNWLDITIICILAAGALDGMLKGFIMSFFNIAGVFISLFAAKYFSGYAVDLIIKNTSIYGSLKVIFDKRMGTMDTIMKNVISMFSTKGTTLSDSMTMAFIGVACFLVIFIFCTIIINIFKNMLKGVVKHTPLIYLDRLLGAGIGLCIAAIFIFIFFAVATPLISIIPHDSAFTAAVGSSKIAKYFFMYNFVIPWVQKMKTMNNSTNLSINFTNILHNIFK